METLRELGDIARLRDRLEGELITADDPRFERASTPWNLSFRHRPSLIVAARHSEDVAAAIDHAGRNGLGVGVQNTGHGVGGVVNGGILILTGLLDRVRVDDDRGTATVGGGATWAPVVAAAQPYGLSPVTGSSLHVGAVGFTIGGGVGWLARRHGLAADHVRSFTVVLADGSTVMASDETEPELFWALRGAGMGSLGVVVEMEIGLVPLSEIFGGNLIYPIEMAAEVFDFYRAWSAMLPIDFTTSFSIATNSPSSGIGRAKKGRGFVAIRGCHCGNAQEAAGLVDELRSWRRPEADTFKAIGVREIGGISNDLIEPQALLSSARWLTGAGHEVVAEMTRLVRGVDGGPPFMSAELRQGGGALGNLRPRSSYTPPDADRLLQVVAATPNDIVRERAKEHVLSFWADLDPWVDSVFLNLTDGDERLEQSRNAFDFDSWDRLTALSARVDPRHMFAHGIDLRSDSHHNEDTSRRREKE